MQQKEGESRVLSVKTTRGSSNPTLSAGYGVILQRLSAGMQQVSGSLFRPGRLY